MNNKATLVVVAGFLLAASASSIAVDPTIDAERSMLKIHVRKAGLFSAAGHEHWVTASFATGSLNGGNSLEVSFTGEYYSGRSRIKQTDFGINPVSLAGGLVRVKNELEVQFVVVPIQNREISENVVRACFSHDCVMRHEE